MNLTPRDTFVRYLDPMKIFWEDAEGNNHFSVVNALQAFHLEDTPEHREKVSEMVRQQIRALAPNAQIIERDNPDHPDFFRQN